MAATTPPLRLRRRPPVGAASLPNLRAISLLLLLALLLLLPPPSEPFAPARPSSSSSSFSSVRSALAPVGLRASSASTSSSTSVTDDVDEDVGDSEPGSSPEEIFDNFDSFLLRHQTEMISEVEAADGSGRSFSRDGWGVFADDAGEEASGRASGGITRVLQGGDVVEKGACSLTIIRDGVLTADRAATIQGRRGGAADAADGESDGIDFVVKEGDVYSAAALSVVLHTRNPYVPTFRSDVRIFLVKSSSDDGSAAWFGGGSDLTPYYLIDEDVAGFHAHLKRMCDEHFPPEEGGDGSDPRSYRAMKRACDDYFYLPARSEHRGTGGIFFDDLPATSSSLAFVRDVARGWTPSWLPIVARRGGREYTEEEKHWQMLRRGRYLEFNLLYDRGVKFGLANANPRVEGVMVSAPPRIAFDYNHVPEEGGEEERLVEVLKNPKDWA